MSLFKPAQLGQMELTNRIFMAPMTRGRAEADGTPTPIMALYYEQRASAGLLISEATAVSSQGVGWVNAPGIFTDAHQREWKKVTEAVHRAKGRIFLQLWHMGRVSHPDFQNGALPVGPSAIAAKGESHTPHGKKSYVTPRALEAKELPGIVNDYVSAARRAIDAGFDGVEIHGANGYLLDQFVRDGSNRRTDAYGGSVENRWRFPLEVAVAVAKAIGGERTGYRISPTGPYNDMADSDPIKTFSYGAEKLHEAGIVYLHVMEPLPGHLFAHPTAPLVHPHLRKVFKGFMILNGGYDRELAEKCLERNEADAIAFGVPFLANPDLVERWRSGVGGMNAPDFTTFYTPGSKGYSDYPTLGS